MSIQPRTRLGKSDVSWLQCSFSGRGGDLRTELVVVAGFDGFVDEEEHVRRNDPRLQGQVLHELLQRPFRTSSGRPPKFALHERGSLAQIVF